MSSSIRFKRIELLDGKKKLSDVLRKNIGSVYFCTFYSWIRESFPELGGHFMTLLEDIFMYIHR